MPFGIASKKDEAPKKATKSNKKNAQSDEAAEILKKMEAKKDDGECAFCQMNDNEGRIPPLKPQNN